MNASNEKTTLQPTFNEDFASAAGAKRSPNASQFFFIVEAFYPNAEDQLHDSTHDILQTCVGLVDALFQIARWSRKTLNEDGSSL